MASAPLRKTCTDHDGRGSQGQPDGLSEGAGGSGVFTPIRAARCAPTWPGFDFGMGRLRPSRLQMPPKKNQRSFGIASHKKAREDTKRIDEDSFRVFLSLLVANQFKGTFSRPLVPPP